MALLRYTRSIDGSIPVQALLYDDEDLFASQENVGIYDGSQKSPDRQSGSIHVSTHRLFYVDNQDETLHSFALDLSYVTQTDYYAGLFKSSPKVTGSPSTSSVPAQFETWECEVCDYRNPPGLSPAAASICALCGVPRSAVPVPEAPQPSLPHQSISLPSSAPISGASTPLSQGRPETTKACPACTFLNHPSLLQCEICSSPLPTTTRQGGRSVSAKSAPTSRPASPEDDSTVSRMIKISFRKGGDKAFYSALKRALKGKAWEISTLGTSTPRHGTGANPDLSVTTRSGISGILQVVESSAQNRESDIQDSLKDLEALMNKARDMVRLAADLNEKLTASTTSVTSTQPTDNIALSDGSVSSNEPEEATFIRSSLSQLGLQMANTPVTLDMMRDEGKWFDELARELAGILQGVNQHPSRSSNSGASLLGERGILPLDEVWGGWNRARGVGEENSYAAAIFRGSCRRTFASGLSVLHTPPYTDAAFAARLSSLLALSGPRSTIELAHEEKVSVGLAAEMIDAVEQSGHICRDDGRAKIKGGTSGGGAEVKWWANVFEGYMWDGRAQGAPLIPYEQTHKGHPGLMLAGLAN
ncbi:hypothetical protein ONZ45_g10078 [Pleurotus djamor]|nr:hypothetical protein ONZ45_g10078 [Pleurotus djamor]